MSMDDWAGESAKGSGEDYVPEDVVSLPVGIEKDGTRYRIVHIERMTGIDDHNLASSDCRKNGAIGTTKVICRCAQEVPGLLSKKPNPEKLFSDEFGRSMCSVDRDYLLTRIFLLSKLNKVTLSGRCPMCGNVERDEKQFTDLEVKTWPEDQPLEIDVHFEDGIKDTVKGVTTMCHNAKLRFPTGREAEYIAKMSNTATIVDMTLASCMHSIEGHSVGTISQEEAKRMTSEDRQRVMLDIQQKLPGLKQWETVECAECERELEIVADLTGFFDVRRNSGKR